MMETKKIYIAAPFNLRHEVATLIAKMSLSCNYRVISRWHLNSQKVNVSNIQIATRNLLDLDESDIVIVINAAESTKGGTHVEMGFALAAKKTILFIGPITNVFSETPSIFHILYKSNQEDLFDLDDINDRLYSIAWTERNEYEEKKEEEKE